MLFQAPPLSNKSNKNFATLNRTMSLCRKQTQQNVPYSSISLPMFRFRSSELQVYSNNKEAEHLVESRRRRALPLSHSSSSASGAFFLLCKRLPTYIPFPPICFTELLKQSSVSRFVQFEAWKHCLRSITRHNKNYSAKQQLCDTHAIASAHPGTVKRGSLFGYLVCHSES